MVGTLTGQLLFTVHRSLSTEQEKQALPDHLKVQYKIKRTPMILMVPRTSKNWMCAFTAPKFQTMSVVRNRNADETQSARTIQARLHTELSHANCRTQCQILRILFTPFGRIDRGRQLTHRRTDTPQHCENV